jgi:hypothetical protein
MESTHRLKAVLFTRFPQDKNLTPLHTRRLPRRQTVKHELKTANKVMWMLIGVIEGITLIAFYLLSLRANGGL